MAIRSGLQLKHGNGWRIPNNKTKMKIKHNGTTYLIESSDLLYLIEKKYLSKRQGVIEAKKRLQTTLSLEGIDARIDEMKIV